MQTLAAERLSRQRIRKIAALFYLSSLLSSISNQMTLPFTIDIHLDATDFAQVSRSGYVSVDCRSPESDNTETLCYCLHCKRVFSLSWSQKHLKRVRRTTPNVSGFFNAEKVELYRRDIISELQLRCESGRAVFRPNRSCMSVPLNRGNDRTQDLMDVFGQSDQALSLWAEFVRNRQNSFCRQMGLVKMKRMHSTMKGRVFLIVY